MFSIFQYRFVGFLLLPWQSRLPRVARIVTVNAGAACRAEHVEINGRNYTLGTYLWSDFMPGTYGRTAAIDGNCYHIGNRLSATLSISQPLICGHKRRRNMERIFLG
jgi:hypothetical protein